MTQVPPRRAAATTLGLLVLLALPSAAHAASATIPLAASDQAPVRLTGGYAQFQGGVPVPQRWTTVGGSVHLRWNASALLADSSAMQVRVGERVVGTVSLHAGAGSASFTVPRQTLRGASRSVPVTIQARLRTRGDICPDTDDPASWLQFDRSSAVVLDGTPSSDPPLLKSLPKSLLTGIGRNRPSVLVRFSTRPTPEAIEAASIAAGELDAVSGSNGLAVRVALPGTKTTRRSGEAAIVVTGTSGPATVNVRTLGQGRDPVVFLSGANDQLVRAAGALRPSVARRLSGSTARGAELPAVVARRGPFPRRIRLPTGSVTGTGEQQITLPFRIPEYLEALRGSRLRLAATYDAPAGGRAVIGINGRDVDSEPLQTRGSTRFFVEEELAPRGPALNRADLHAGGNQVTVTARLSTPLNLRCQPSETGGGLQVSDFGSVTLLTRPRPVTETLSVFPFPLSQKSGWSGATVQLPASPSEAELGGIVGTLAESRRVTQELVLPKIQLGGDLPSGTALVLARPGNLPKPLLKNVPGPQDAGLLTASKSGGSVRILAVGAKALQPLANEYYVGKVQGRTVEALSAENTAIRVPDKELVTGIERGPVPWRWPLLVIGLAILAFAALALRRTMLRLRRRTAPVPPPDPTEPTEPRKRDEDEQQRNG